MKHTFKVIVSLLLAVVLFGTMLPADGFNISASAAEKLSSSVSYKEDGTAVVTLEASDFFNLIRYTTDGTAPTKKSPVYTGPIEIAEKTTLRVGEYSDGTKVKGIKLNVSPKTGKVSFDVTQLGDGKALLVMECATEDAELRYTTDGTKPNQDSKLYTGPLFISEKTKFRVRAYKDGYKTTTTYAKTVTISDPEPDEEKETAEPAKETEPEKETVKEEKVTEKVVDDQKISYKITYMDDGRSYVTLTPAKNGYTIRYTTDGSTPTAKTGKKYKSRVKFEEPGVLRARQYNKAGQCVGTIKLNVKIKCADVQYICTDIGYGTRTIKLTCDTPGATIYYTTNGATPKPGCAYVYDEPFVVGDLADVKTVAVREGYKNSNYGWEIAAGVTMIVDGFDFSDPIYQQTADIINQYRIDNWSYALTLDEGLTEAACLRAKETSVYQSHQRPTGANYTSAIRAYGVPFEYSCEMYAAGFDSPASVLTYFLTNVDNKINIVGSGYPCKKLGVGYYKVGGVSYWVILITD